MKAQLDVHTHSIASGHAYGTVTEMAKAASEKGLKLLGITEHTEGIPGTCSNFYFTNLGALPREMFFVVTKTPSVELPLTLTVEAAVVRMSPPVIPVRKGSAKLTFSSVR